MKNFFNTNSFEGITLPREDGIKTDDSKRLEINESQLTLVAQPDVTLKSDYTTYTYSIPVPAKYRYDPDNKFLLTYRIHNSFSTDQIQLISDAIEYLSQNVWVNDEEMGDGPQTDMRSTELPFYDPKLFEVQRDGTDSSALNYAVFLAFWHYPNHENEVLRNKHNLLIIDRFDELPTEDGTWTLGRAEVNAFHILRHCHIDLNGLAMGSSSTYPRALDYKEWAGTILHECFHNFGWRHVESATDAIMVRYADGAVRGIKH
ncbi:hypothetical protein [Bacillus cereus]|uniref:hypothetical protein n=1 Tax=Bacillus cereus TaxID=1396 RepID=UPI00397F5DCC